MECLRQRIRARPGKSGHREEPRADDSDGEEQAGEVPGEGLERSGSLVGRLDLVTDRGLAAVVRERFPKPVVYPVLFLVVFANTFNVGADVGSMAAALRLLAPIPTLAGVAMFAVVITILEVRVPYTRYARLLRWLVLSLAAYVGVLLAVHVPWGEVLRHTVAPHMAWDRKHLAALIAIFGTTISPYLFFWQAAEEMEESDAGRTTPTEIRRMRIDVVLGIAAGVGVMFAILTATAVTLGVQGANQPVRAASSNTAAANGKEITAVHSRSKCRVAPTCE